MGANASWHFITRGHSTVSIPIRAAVYCRHVAVAREVALPEAPAALDVERRGAGR